MPAEDDTKRGSSGSGRRSGDGCALGSKWMKCFKKGGRDQQCAKLWKVE